MKQCRQERQRDLFYCRVTTAFPVLVGSACEITVMVTVLPVIGMAAGGVYSPALMLSVTIVPTVDEPPVMPLTCRVYPRFRLPTA